MCLSAVLVPLTVSVLVCVLAVAKHPLAGTRLMMCLVYASPLVLAFQIFGTWSATKWTTEPRVRRGLVLANALGAAASVPFVFVCVITFLIPAGGGM